MSKKLYLFTSESVSEGHPDKVCDRISDMVVDTYLAKEPFSRVGCETLATTNKVILAGETRGPEIKKDDLINKVRNCIKDIGYEQKGFHWKNCSIDVHLHSQSADIAMGVDSKGNKDDGAGDQGMMFGYACNETDSLMPSPIDYSHRITKALSDARHNGTSWLGPDGKSQITFLYSDINTPIGISNVVCSTQHDPSLTREEVETGVKEIINPIVSDYTNADTTFFINPTGRFVIGGPDGDTGLTGRKIIVDTYGGYAPHGGGAFSGKDCVKVDRSGAYIARYLAKNIVASGMANNATIQLSYAIGIEQPTSLYVYADGQVRVDLADWFINNIDLTPLGIINKFDLFNIQLTDTTNYGHFGKNNLPWEQIDLTDELKTL